MNFNWLKKYMPRGLYGRATLILLVPIVSIQLFVSVVFIQRHFDGVTRQMVSNVVLEINHLLAVIEAAPDRETALVSAGVIAKPLQLRVGITDFTPGPHPDQKVYSDLTAPSVLSTLREAIPRTRSIDLLSDPRLVNLRISTEKGELSVVFDRSRVSASNPHQLLVLMLLASAFLTIIAVIFLRNQLRPITRLSRAAEAFGKGQSLAYRPAGASEVRSAGQAFLNMRARIERHIEQRTLMLSGVSHDLRTPLTRLKLGLSLDDAAEDSAALMQDVDDMEQMLDEFLAFARGDARESLETVNPIELAKSIAQKNHRSKQDIIVEVSDLAPDQPEVMLRPMAIGRALENLIGNAVRYGSKVRLTTELDADRVEFVVEDDGPGIPVDLREEALRPFARLEAARNQNRVTGVGLGLSIAADIAHSHGGSLDLSDSDDLGGLKASLRLPR